MTESTKQKLIAVLGDIVASAVPDASEFEKYGGTLYTVQPDIVEGQFCGIFAYKAHVQLSFANGNELNDPGGILSGSGKYRRHVNFTSSSEIDEKQLNRLLKVSAKLSKKKSG
ncbi:MAG: DUF1801 domain-containing protein [Planctomycetota bacterium]